MDCRNKEGDDPDVIVGIICQALNNARLVEVSKLRCAGMLSLSRCIGVPVVIAEVVFGQYLVHAPAAAATEFFVVGYYRYLRQVEAAMVTLLCGKNS
jgi:hypothetical protein